MEAKDTVIGKNQTIELSEEGSIITPVLWEFLERVKEAQAEISFKAGQQAERVSWLLKTDPEKTRDNFTKQIIERTREQALKEVVEWIEAHEKSLCMDCLCAFDFRSEEWQAKIKEWGIED